MTADEKKLSDIVAWLDAELGKVIEQPEERVAERNWILSHYLEITKETLLLSPHQSIQLDARYDALQCCVKTRIEERMPLQYLLGEAWFYGRRFIVTPAVLVPRADTEILIQQALQIKKENVRVVDLGSGSGCIAVTLKLERPDWDVTTIDISSEALKVARQNTEYHGASVRFLEGSWFEPLTNEKFDIVVSNPPYVSNRALAPEVLHQPALALFPDEPPDALYRFLFEKAKQHLNPEGTAFFEMEAGQASRLKVIAEEMGFCVETTPDYGGIDRVIALRLQ